MTAPNTNTNTPNVVVLPGTGAPVKSAVEQASDDARARLATGGTALPGTPPRVGAGHPQGGQFAKSALKEVGSDVPDPSNPALELPPAGGQPPQTGDQPPPQAGDTPPAGEAPPATGADESGGDEQQQTPPGEGEGDENPLAVEVPLGDGGESLVIEAADEAAAESLRETVALANDGRRAQLLIETAQRQMDVVEEFNTLREADPVGAALQTIGRDMDAAEHLVLFLATQPSLHQRLLPALKKLVDPAGVREVNLAQRERRMTATQERETTIAEKAAVKQNFQEINATIEAILPPDLKPEQRNYHYRNMLREIGDYAEANGMLTLPVHLIPQVAAETLTALGVDPEAAAAKAAVALARRSAGKSLTPGRVAVHESRIPGRSPTPNGSNGNGKPGTPAPVPPKKSPTPTAADFQKSRATKRAAATPGGGAGSPTSNLGALTPPRKADGSVMSTEETIKWHRDRLKKGVRSF